MLEVYIDKNSMMWWMNQFYLSVRSFVQHPTKEGYLSLVEMSNHYLDLVSDGIITPARPKRITAIKVRSRVKVNYWIQKLDEKAVLVIRQPSSLNVQGLKVLLKAIFM